LISSSTFLIFYFVFCSYNDEANRASRYCRPQVITLASKAMANSAAAAFASHQLQQQQHQQQHYQQHYQQQQQQQQARLPITVTAGGCGMASHEGRIHGGLPRALSAPIIQMQPKSCLSRRSCLHRSTTANSSDSRNSDAASAETECANCKCNEQSRCRKRVIFADDEGQPLTEVRVMSEPSNVPPLWSTKFLEQITQGLVSPHPADQWTVDKLFEKFLLQAYGPATFAHVVFDTFSFKITLPPSSKRLEFCICYRANDQEYWDNNGAKNYTITK
ncbi:PREDICTED: ras-interacting protein RIP3, partial [Rhagoletis zephyria]|uniref:ras-interacting protein RIP3 n=1 Tax=Rhagoletis zephyria TaxID=28612 RepID=UPI000811A3E1